MHEIRTKKVNKIPKRKGNFMKNLALFALAAVVAFSMSQNASAQGTRFATKTVEALVDTKAGRMALESFTGTKLAKEADLIAAANKFIEFKGGEAVASASIISKISSLNAELSSSPSAGMVQSKVSTFAPSQSAAKSKAMFKRADAQATSALANDPGYIELSQLIDSTDVDASLKANAKAQALRVSEEIQKPVWGVKYVCEAASTCAIKFGNAAKTTIVKSLQFADVTAKATVALAKQSIGTALSKETNVSVLEGIKNACTVSKDCSVFNPEVTCAN